MGKIKGTCGEAGDRGASGAASGAGRGACRQGRMQRWMSCVRLGVPTADVRVSGSALSALDLLSTSGLVVMETWKKQCDVCVDAGTCNVWCAVDCEVAYTAGPPDRFERVLQRETASREQQPTTRLTNRDPTGWVGLLGAEIWAEKSVSLASCDPALLDSGSGWLAQAGWL
jgi:hypothetical protein